MTTTGNIAGVALRGFETDMVRPVHEHGWLVESRHPTSLGWVLYVRCAGCGARRVDVQASRGAVPEPSSTVLA